MAILSAINRQEIWAQAMRDASTIRDNLALTKDDLRAVVNAIDNWIDINGVNFNGTLPLPARTALTAKQKAWLLAMVIQRRWQVS